MILLRLFEFIVIYSFIKLFVFCDFTTSSEEEHVNVNSLNENSAENIVLDSVYDTMKNNYELRMQQNMQKMNLMSEIRNKRNINEPINSQNSMEVYRNHQLNMNPNAKVPMGYPVGFKPSQPKYYQQVVGPPAFPNPRDRSEYEYEEYTKCQEKPTVQTFHISDHKQEDHKHHLPELSGVLLTGLKYLLGGFAILALPFIVLKALLLPLKFLIFFKAFALAKTFFLMTFLYRLFKWNRRIYGLNGLNNLNNINRFPLIPGKNKQKLQTIKDILNSQDDLDGDIDYDKSEDEETGLSKENVETPMLLEDSSLNSSEVGEEIVQNLVKLIKLKNKNW